jgi:adenylosuccinate lyase
MIERYAIPEMEAIWSDRSRYSRWLEIEILAVEARSLQGAVPEEDLRLIRENASFDPDRVDEIERTVRHDVIAFLTSVSESLGPESRHIHYGMTSSDILDTCLATQLRDSGRLITEALDAFGESLAGLVSRTRGIACMGRSHGMHAEPTTLAIKFAGYHAEYQRCRSRLESGLRSACVGKVSGAVGTFAHLSPSVEEHVCGRLGIGVEPVATQVVARDRHAEFVFALAAIGCLLERFGTEVRHLQRTEVGEVEESFGSGQKGSSAMPHKRNPIVSERLCGFSRLLRGYLLAALEDTALWHERDISHSSAERFIFPDACGIALYSLRKAVELAAGLRVFPEAVRENILAAGDRYHSQTVMLALSEVGLSREEAYSLVQAVAMKAMEEGTGFLDALRIDGTISSLLAPAVLEERCSLDYHIRNEDAIINRLGLSVSGTNGPRTSWKVDR